MPAPSGGTTIVNYYWEPEFLEAPDGDDPKLFGGDAQLATNEATRNANRIRLPASHKTVAFDPTTFDGAWGLQGILTNPWWLRGVLGEPETTDNGDGTYTHVYDGTPDPMRIIQGYETLGAERELQGCVPQNASIDPTVGEGAAQITLEGFYAYEETDTDADVTEQTGLEMDTLGYTDAELTVDGDERYIVQEASWALETGAEPIEGFGSNFPVSYWVGAMDPTLNYSAIKQNFDALESVYGGSDSMQEDPDADEELALGFDNGKEGEDTNQIDIINELSWAESYGEDTPGDVQQVLQENLNYLLGESRVEATNGVETPP